MKKKFIVIISIITGVFILFNILLTPKIYLKYVFYNFEKGNYDIVSYLNDKDKNNIVKIYEFCKKNDLPKPLKFIRKENDDYYVMLKIILYDNDKDNYGTAIGTYNIDLNIKIKDKLLLPPKIKKIDFQFKKEDVTEWFNHISNEISCSRNSF